MGQIVGQKLRTKNKLTPLALKKLKVPGRYSDGNNLYLKIEDIGLRRWILRLSVNGKRRNLILSKICYFNSVKKITMLATKIRCEKHALTNKTAAYNVY